MGELFKAIESKSSTRDYKIKFSYLEIYNEMIRDLLGEDPTEVLDLREDPVKGLAVAGLSERTGESSEQVMKYLLKGNKNRTQESTGANETSSRSHAVFQITVEYVDKGNGEAETKSGKLSLIDLAGSERAAQTCNRGIRMVEGANINRSLLALGNCINKLCEQIAKGQRLYIPYRDSKLTRLLKDSLGGNCQTVMIANVSPSSATYEDTHNTLKYANRAKNIKTKVSQNVHVTAQQHIAQYAQMITQLKHEIFVLRRRLAASNPELSNKSMAVLLFLDLLCGANSVEEEVFIALKEINEHHGDESNVRLSLYKIRQNIEAANLRLLAQKSHLETVTSDKRQEVQKELEASKIHLRQLLINEEVLLNRMRELQHEKASLQHKVRRNNLGELWTPILLTQLDHERDITQHIPIEGDALHADTNKLVQLQQEDIEKLREQLVIRDKMIERSRKGSDLAARKDILSYEEVLKTVETLKAKDQIAGSNFGHPVQERLFMKMNRLGHAKGIHYIEQQKKSDREKRNYSVASQNSSFSTGASSGAVPGLLKLANPLAKDSVRGSIKNSKINHRQLINAGTRIVVGPTKSLLSTDKLTLMAASENKESKPKLPKLRPSRFILERPRFVYENKAPFH